MFRHTVLRSGRPPSALRPAGRSLSYDPESHLRAWPVTGLLIARDGEILFESYAMGRSAEMRMTGWSMSNVWVISMEPPDG